MRGVFILKIRNWERYQPKMKDRDVIWIKLYRRILEDYEWHNLTSDSKATLIELLLLASEDNGRLPSIEKVAFRLRKETNYITNEINNLSHWIQLDDNLVTTCNQNVALEKSREEKKRDIRFQEFWDVLLKKRKNNKVGCKKKWEKNDLDEIADTIINWYKQMCTTQEWKEGFNPSPEVIINQRRWEDDDGNVTPKIRGRVL